MTTRIEAKNTVDAWIADKMTAEQVWHWASEAKEGGEYEDKLVRDVVDILAGLPYDVIIVEDAEIMSYGLGNPPYEADLAQNLLWNHLDTVDEEGRRAALKDDAFYSQFFEG